jgi:hypothetical protein
MERHLGIFLVLVGLAIFRIASAQTNTAYFRLDDETKNIFKNATEDSWFKKEAFTSALLGGLTAVVAAWLAYRWELAKEKNSDQEFDQRVLEAIQIEIKTLLGVYEGCRVFCFGFHARVMRARQSPGREWRRSRSAGKDCSSRESATT